jgi:hypothetical protein
MNVVLSSLDRTLVSLTRDELLALNNALNEVCNGIHIENRDFHARVGVERSVADALLAQVGAALEAPPNGSEFLEVWSDQGVVMVKAITAYGDPTELSEHEARKFADDLARACEGAR